MSNMATGIPIGLAIGIGAGIASGKKQARETIEKNIRNLLVTHTMDIRDGNGQSLTVDQFISLIFNESEIISKCRKEVGN